MTAKRETTGTRSETGDDRRSARTSPPTAKTWPCLPLKCAMPRTASSPSPTTIVNFKVTGAGKLTRHWQRRPHQPAARQGNLAQGFLRFLHGPRAVRQERWQRHHRSGLSRTDASHGHHHGQIDHASPASRDVGPRSAQRPGRHRLCGGRNPPPAWPAGLPHSPAMPTPCSPFIKAAVT